jgi:hypothetical protein
LRCSFHFLRFSVVLSFNAVTFNSFPISSFFFLYNSIQPTACSASEEFHFRVLNFVPITTISGGNIRHPWTLLLIICEKYRPLLRLVTNISCSFQRTEQFPCELLLLLHTVL